MQSGEMTSDGALIATLAGSMALAALAIFVVRRLVVDPEWNAARRRAFLWLADFLKSLASTLVGVTLIGYVLEQMEGTTFSMDTHGLKLLGASCMFLVTGLVLAITASAKDDAAA